MRPILVATIAAVAAVAASFAIATAANKPTPSSATDKAVLQELQSLGRSVKALHKSIGTSPLIGLRGEVRATKGAVEATKSELGGQVRGMGLDLTWIRSDLTKVCRAVSC